MNCLDEYKRIFERYPLSDRRLKKQRHAALNDWRADKTDLWRIKAEVCVFIGQNPDIINPVFIKRAVCPLLDECLNKSEYGFIADLIHTVGADKYRKNSIKDILYIYCEYIAWEKTPIMIADEILSRIDSDILSESKFDLMQEQIYYSIHELPVGLLLEDVFRP